jgi:hypothetical protein
LRAPIAVYWHARILAYIPVMRSLPVALLIVAIAAILAPAAHLLELPNKLAMDGALWLAVQQSLYRGWGPVVGAPTEFAGLALATILSAQKELEGRRFWRRAAVLYAAMVGVFLAFNAPVNAAVAGWTAAALPPDWSAYRLRWEAGHAAAALLSFMALFAVLRGCFAACRPVGQMRV